MKAFLRLFGDGLGLRTYKNGASAYVFTYGTAAQKKRVTIGSSEEISYAEARFIADSYNALLKDGVIPPKRPIGRQRNLDNKRRREEEKASNRMFKIQQRALEEADEELQHARQERTAQLRRIRERKRIRIRIRAPGSDLRRRQRLAAAQGAWDAIPQELKSYLRATAFPSCDFWCPICSRLLPYIGPGGPRVFCSKTCRSLFAKLIRNHDRPGGVYSIQVGRKVFRWFELGRLNVVMKAYRQRIIAEREAINHILQSTILSFVQQELDDNDAGSRKIEFEARNERRFNGHDADYNPEEPDQDSGRMRGALAQSVS